MSDFYLSFGGELDPQNRWVKLAKIVPWHLVEKDYRANFASSGIGAPFKESRIALGALIIKERLGVTGEDPLAQTRENAYLQYLLGYIHRISAPSRAAKSRSVSSSEQKYQPAMWTGLCC